uniref:Uncharacterized protein n=1 Tax=Photinus pyralis TaxID=7054 RepID=A0A1Y1L797_PHOPY
MSVSEDTPADSHPESIWEKIETSIKVQVPTYLKNLLAINGYDNVISLSTLDDNTFQELETFAKATLPSLIDENEFFKYYGIFAKNVTTFSIVGGHKVLLKKVAEYLANDFKKHQTTGNVKVKKNSVKRKITQSVINTVESEVESNDQENMRNILGNIDINLEQSKINENCVRFIKENYNAFEQSQNVEPKFLRILQNLDTSRIDFNVRIHSDIENSNFNRALVTCCFCNCDIKIPRTIVTNANGENVLYWVHSNFYKHMKTHFDVNKSRKKLSNRTIDGYFVRQTLKEKGCNSSCNSISNSIASEIQSVETVQEEPQDFLQAGNVL